MGFILNLVKNNVFQREWHQIKIKDNNITGPGFRKGQEQILGFLGGHIYLFKVRNQRVCTVLPSGQSIFHILCVHLNRITVNSHFPEPAGEQNNALNQENTNLLFLQCCRAHSHGFTACLHYGCESFQDASLPMGKAGWQEATPSQADMNTRLSVQPPLQLMQRSQPVSLFHLYSE